jgi:hypothetical protein
MRLRGIMGWGVLKPRACSSSEFMFSMHRLHRRLIFIYPEWTSYFPLPNFWYWPATIFCFVPPNCSPVASDRPDQDRGCSAEPVVTTNHINVEGWTESYASTWAEIQRDYPQNAPRNLGNMGFLIWWGSGVCSLFHCMILIGFLDLCAPWRRFLVGVFYILKLKGSTTWSHIWGF